MHIAFCVSKHDVQVVYIYNTLCGGSPMYAKCSHTIVQFLHVYIHLAVEVCQYWGLCTAQCLIHPELQHATFADIHDCFGWVTYRCLHRDLCYGRF